GAARNGLAGCQPRFFSASAAEACALFPVPGRAGTVVTRETTLSKDTRGVRCCAPAVAARPSVSARAAGRSVAGTRRAMACELVEGVHDAAQARLAAA